LFQEVEHTRPSVNQGVQVVVVSVLTHDLVKELESAEKHFDRLMCLIGFEHQEKTLAVLTHKTMELVNQVIFDSTTNALGIAFPALCSAHLPCVGFQVRKKRQQRPKIAFNGFLFNACCCLFPENSQLEMKLILAIED
jgi:hypothetical protein